jgi:hypothetical protein
MNKNDSLLWTSQTHAEAESAIRALHRSGIDITTLSILGKGYHSQEQSLGFYNVGAKMRTWLIRSARRCAKCLASRAHPA